MTIFIFTDKSPSNTSMYIIMQGCYVARQESDKQLMHVLCFIVICVYSILQKPIVPQRWINIWVLRCITKISSSWVSVEIYSRVTIFLSTL